MRDCSGSDSLFYEAVLHHSPGKVFWERYICCYKHGVSNRYTDDGSEPIQSASGCG